MSHRHDEQPSGDVARDDAHEKDSSDIGEVIGAPGEGALRGWETYSRAELDRILPRYDLGHIEMAREYRRGSRSAPKLKISSERGEFLLKRRLLERHPVARIRYSHALQAALARQGFPVAPLLADRSTGDTMIVAGEYAYEMFRFVIGERYDKTIRGAARAGDALARLHRITRDFDTSQSVTASFHNSQTVRSALARLPASVRRVDPGVDEKFFGDAVRYLDETYARAIEEVRDLGFAGLRPSAVHGDWHPGNVIFQRGSANLSIAAVIDFDSTRSEPWITEIANGMAQFAIRGEGGTSPLDWPADFDARRLQAFLHGYLGGSPRPLTLEERSMIPWLMVEAIIAESAVPVANQGSFADLPGAAFMDLVARKCEWVRQHRKAISAL